MWVFSFVRNLVTIKYTKKLFHSLIRRFFEKNKENTSFIGYPFSL